jgi:integrase
MPRVAETLTDKQVKALTKPGHHPVGGVPGLLLQIRPSGSRYWVYRTHIAGKRSNIGIGSTSEYSLAEAREEARELRRQVRVGRNPIEERRNHREAMKRDFDRRITFKDAWDGFWVDKRTEFSEATAHHWESSMDRQILPVIGTRVVSEIDKTDIETVLRPLWETKTVTAKKLRGRMERVLSWSTVKGYREGDNPARWNDNLKEILPSGSNVHKTTHLRALQVSDAPDFMAELRHRNGIAARALEFTILTAVRSGESRGALWSEIDFKRGAWNIPAERMKMSLPHIVPLSDGALTVLDQVRGVSNNALFPAPRSEFLSDMSLLAVLKRMGWHDRTTVHGFRAVFKSWANEVVDVPDFVSEMALAHSVGDSIQKAYRRSDLWSKRLRLMLEWSKFLGYSEAGGAVIKLEARA